MTRRLVVEADGGSRGNPGPAAYGAVVRDASTGEILAEMAEYIGRATNNVAEYRGLVAGLAAARQIDPDAPVEARLDSKLVVEQMSGRWKVKHDDMRRLALDAAALRPPAGITFTWVPRAQNTRADRLANEALDAAAAGRDWSPRAAPDPAEPPNAPTSRPANRLVGWALDLGRPTRLVLLRHGETAFTAEKRFSGSGASHDPWLSDTGRAQAVAAASALAADEGEERVQAVVASPLRRARETADEVASLLGVDVAVDDGWREAAFGEWEGLRFDEVADRWPRELAAWLADPSVAPPGGESLDAVAERVGRARDETIARYAGTAVCVVSHVTPIKTVVRLALDAPDHAVHRMELSPASFSEVAYFSDGLASMRRFNDVAHHSPAGAALA